MIVMVPRPLREAMRTSVMPRGRPRPISTRTERTPLPPRLWYEGMEEEVERIEAGADAVLVVDLRPGSYEVYCPVEDNTGNHKQKGMTTRLTVQ